MSREILIVDDQQIWCDWQKEILEGRGYTCHIAQTGLDAISIIHNDELNNMALH